MGCCFQVNLELMCPGCLCCRVVEVPGKMIELEGYFLVARYMGLRGSLLEGVEVVVVGVWVVSIGSPHDHGVACLSFGDKFVKDEHWYPRSVLERLAVEIWHTASTI